MHVSILDVLPLSPFVIGDRSSFSQQDLGRMQLQRFALPALGLS